MGLFKKIFRKLYQDSTPADGPYQYDKQSHVFADTLFQINVTDAVELLMILDHYTPPPHLQDVDYEDQAADMLAEALRGDTGAQRILTDLIVRACGLLPTPYTGELTIRQLMHQALSGDLQSQKKVAAIIQPLAIPELEPEEGYILEIGLDSGQTRQEWRASALVSNLSSRIEKHQKFQELEKKFSGDDEMIRTMKATWLTSRGNLHAGQRDFDSAIQDFKEAIRLKGDHIPAHLGIAIAYKEKGMFQHALATLRNTPHKWKMHSEEHSADPEMLALLNALIQELQGK